MKYMIFSETELSSYPICLLVPQIRKEDIKKAYLDTSSIDPNELLIVDLYQSPVKKKTPMNEMREYIEQELQSVLDDSGVEYIICADAEYFKAFTKLAKTEAYLGYVCDSAFGSQKIVYVPNFKAIFYDPDKVRAKIAQGLNALQDHRNGSYSDVGKDIIHTAFYPKSYDDIKAWLDKLLDDGKPLTCDIEAFSLKHYDAGIGSITFCWNQHEGIAFSVDYQAIEGATEAPYGTNVRNEPIRELLKQFFIEAAKRKIKLIFHNIAYDVYVLIYQLFMEDLLDTEGLLYGLEILLENWHCTKLITYLATNSCAGNKLGLKDQAQEFAGNYAVDEITDITKIPEKQLLQYNLTDGLSTWFVYHKHWATMIEDQQYDIYKEIFTPAIVDIIQMQLTGLPVDMNQVKKAKVILQDDNDKALHTIMNNKYILEFTEQLNEQWVIARNNKLKVKRVTIEDANETFNPNSGPQLQQLLFTFLNLPVLGLTKNKEPETGADTLKSLKNHTDDEIILELLDGLIDYKAVDKILTTFIVALENSVQGPDGWYYLFGNFNLGGTVSGRLSSSKPNLQNLPSSGTKYAKLIKQCFAAPPGWLFCGLDFNSLEDMISALTTKDPQKLRVYTDGFDGHCLRAFAYYGEHMPDIIDGDVASINSIAVKYKPLRQESKAPTFALTYQGTYLTLMTNCGFSEDKAKTIETRYHELYKVSDQWIADKLDKASKDGYITVAFGLRVRTPLLHQVIRGTSKTPFQAEAEGRTAGNAAGQSWCLLNSRCGSGFMKQVRKSEFRLTIRICAQIHDANYFIIKDDLAEVMYCNEHLVKEAQWQEHPDIQHDQVKLGGEFFVCYPNWSKEINIPNGIKQDDLIELISGAIND